MAEDKGLPSSCNIEDFINSQKVVLSREDSEEFIKLVLDCAEHYQPRDNFEIRSAVEIASLKWNLGRLYALEAKIVSGGTFGAPKGPSATTKFLEKPHSSVIDALRKYRASLDLSIVRVAKAAGWLRTARIIE